MTTFFNLGNNESLSNYSWNDIVRPATEGRERAPLEKENFRPEDTEETEIFIRELVQNSLDAKDRDDSFRLMGFGHRVYKNYDPRANVLRKYCHNLLKEIDTFNLPLFELATKLEEIALNDSYFIKKKLYPNVDFYSGIILKALGMPESMFTVIFAVARTVGWISQWKEMTELTNNKISRPRQLYTGKNIREFIEINRRENLKKMYPGEIN